MSILAKFSARMLDLRSEYKEKYLAAYKYLKWKQRGENNNLFIDIHN